MSSGIHPVYSGHMHHKKTLSSKGSTMIGTFSPKKSMADRYSKAAYKKRRDERCPTYQKLCPTHTEGLWREKLERFPWTNLLPIAMQVAAKTIGLDLVPVKPMAGPSNKPVKIDKWKKFLDIFGKPKV